MCDLGELFRFLLLFFSSFFISTDIFPPFFSSRTDFQIGLQRVTHQQCFFNSLQVAQTWRYTFQHRDSDSAAAISKDYHNLTRESQGELLRQCELSLPFHFGFFHFSLVCFFFFFSFPFPFPFPFISFHFLSFSLSFLFFLSSSFLSSFLSSFFFLLLSSCVVLHCAPWSDCERLFSVTDSPLRCACHLP